MGKFISLEGQRFGRLKVLARATNRITKSGGQRTQWLCKCSCGIEKIVAAYDLRSGHTTSCGCFAKELMSKRMYKHGATLGKIQTKEYTTWHGAKKRCFKTTEIGYPDYGGRGITMSSRWVSSFENFLQDMGLCPKGFTLERKDVNGNYEPSNCLWIPAKEQQYNKRNTRWVEYEGDRFSLSQLAEKLEVSPYRLQYFHVVRGLSVSEALDRCRQPKAPQFR